ncbi:ATP-binding protein [Photobacterium leiognathi]|uniref:ATP-binding protein n=1 Tax=Photobacterium leiognathi TaxID=553611 RepID=UPI002980A3C5|nr:transporter substrate-binding domain-containing protein [Photobacterium leiognathi]
MRYLFIILSVWFSSHSWANTDIEHKQKVLKAGYLTLGSSPLVFTNSKNELSGLLPDLMNHIAKKSHLELESVAFNNPKEIISALEKNEIDFIIGISLSFERKRNMVFSQPILAVPYGMISNDSYKDREKEKKIIAIEDGFMPNDLLQQKDERISALIMPDILLALNSVKTGISDAYIGNAITLNNLFTQANIKTPLKFSILEQLPLEKMHIATSKVNSYLLNIINDEISSLEDGELRSIYKKWLTRSQIDLLEHPNRIKLSQQERAYIRSKSILRIGYQFDQKCYKDNDIFYLQIADIVHKFSNILNVDFKFVNVHGYDAAREMLDRGEIDIISAVAISPLRKKQVNFTMPFGSESWVIVNKIEDKNIYGITQKNKIGVVDSAFVANLARNLYPNNEMLTFNAQKDMLLRLMNDEIDYAIISLSQAQLLLQNEFLGQLKIVPSKLDNHPRNVSFAVSRDNFVLRNIINKILNSFPEETFSDIKRRLNSVTIKSSINYSKLVSVITVSAFIVIFIIYWNRRLSLEITQRKNVEQKLTYLTNNFDGALIQHIQKSEDPFDVEFLFISEKISNFINLNASQLYRHPHILFEQMKKRDDIDSLHAAMQQAVHAGYWSTNLQIQTQTYHPRWIELRCQISEVENGWQWNTIIIDITQAKEQQVALMEANAKSLAATESKSRFLAMMSHEIRTPISGILSLLELMEPHAQKPELRQIHHNLSQSGLNLLNIVNDVLDFSKIEAGKLNINPSRHVLSDLIHALVQPHSIHANQKEVSFTLWLDPAVAHYLSFDDFRLTQVLNNLLNNAIKFTTMGNIHLAVDVVKETNTEQTLAFTIHDTGIGIKPEDLSQLFQPFVQVEQSSNRRFSGTGLGLSICYQLVQLMNGDIHATSEVGKGTSFTVIVPFPIIEKRDVSPLHKHCGLIGDIYDLHLNEYLSAWQCEYSYLAITNKAKLPVVISTEKIDTILIHDTWCKENEVDSAWLKANLPSVNVIMITSPDHYLTQNQANGSQLSLSPLLPNELYRVLANEKDSQDTEQTTQPQVANKLDRELAIKQGRYILVAEDHPINQQILKQQLELLNCAVDIVDNGKKALDALANKKYNLLISDCHMPELDGFELVKAIRQQEQLSTSAPLPILALTADALSNKAHFQDIGFNDYLIKPITLKELETVVYQWLPMNEVNSATSPLAHEEKSNVNEASYSELIDINELDAIFGDRETSLDILTQYLTSCDSDLSEFKQAIKENNIDLISLVVHRAKGAARVMAFHQLDQLCQTIEGAVSQNQPIEFEEHYQNMTRLVSLLKQQVITIKSL